MCNNILRVFEKLGHPSATLCLKSEILKRTAAHMASGIHSLHEVTEKGWKRMKKDEISSHLSLISRCARRIQYDFGNFLRPTCPNAG